MKDLSASSSGLDIMTGLAPIITPECRVLILGSFPSSISLSIGEYYANPRNDFWKIMEEIFSIPHFLAYDDRVSALVSCRCGLWDVISRCRRVGSADNTIRDIQSSPIGDLLTRYPSVQTIVCNGRKAEAGITAALSIPEGAEYEKIPWNRKIVYFPSTSPAHAIPFKQKLAEWKKIRDFVL
jgi:hypoxanthine-DNA glycosylase